MCDQKVPKGVLGRSLFTTYRLDEDVFQGAAVLMVWLACLAEPRVRARWQQAFARVRGTPRAVA